MKPILGSGVAIRAGAPSITMCQSLHRLPQRALTSSAASRSAFVFRSSRTPSTVSLSRGYSTAPNQQQVLQSFGSPFAQFIYTISRIARIITYSALGVATVGVVSFEAAHQYVEHIGMPATSSSSSQDVSDEYGWSELALEESWSGSPDIKGTDPRLGIKGRHAVRSAWMCANWGAGISPSIMFGGSSSSGLGGTAVTSMGAAKPFHVDNGMTLAVQYLNLAVKIAASKHIKLPDIEAIRAGLISEAAAKQELSHVDPLALALEARLAAIHERQGTRGALESAIGSYEKLYNIASLTESSSGQHASRLVRLATKLGDLYLALDRQPDAEEWLNRAVGIAATAGASTPELNARSGQVSKVESMVQEKEKRKGSLRGWFSGSSKSSAESPVEPIQVAEPRSALINKETAAATPALTRSLIAALVSKSALHARTPTSSSLQQALHTQMSALQLACAELNRLLAHPSTQCQAELHKLWIIHHQSILDLHVAETMFALTRTSCAISTSKLIASWFKAGVSNTSVGERSIEWLHQADQSAQQVVRALQACKTANPNKANKLDGDVVLDERWANDNVVALAAGRVLRDARRVQATAQRSRSTLEAL